MGFTSVSRGVEGRLGVKVLIQVLKSSYGYSRVVTVRGLSRLCGFADFIRGMQVVTSL